MARKIAPKTRVTAPAKPAAADELDILHPERSATLGGRRITVREYGFVEGLRLRPLMQPFTDALHRLMQDGQPLPYEQALSLMAEHIDSVLELVAVAADVELDFVQQLSDDDGQTLLMLWWGANHPFFLRRVQSRLQIERLEALGRNSAGAPSTPPSSPTATTGSSSAATPNAS